MGFSKDKTLFSFQCQKTMFSFLSGLHYLTKFETTHFCLLFVNGALHCGCSGCHTENTHLRIQTGVYKRKRTGYAFQ